MRMHDTEAGTVDEDWDVLVSFFPQDWRELAQDTGALKGLRKDKTVDNLLRTLLLHLGCGHSLRETVVRARQAHLADLSDVALLKRLKKSKGWLHALCVRLFEEQGLAVIPGGAFQVRAVDATTVKEPGPSGSLWRLHYSVGLPSLACDFFKLTGTEGPGTGESLAQFPIRAGDHVLADRGYSTARGIRHVVDAGGRLIVRVNTGSLPLCTTAGRPFDLLAAVGSVTRPGAVRSWAITVAVPGDDGGPAGKIAGRVCVLRKSAEAIRLAHQKVRRDAARKGNQVQPATLRFAEYVIVFTTFPEPPFSAADVPGGFDLAGVVSPALAGRIGVQALQVAGPVGARAEVRRRQRQGVALRETVRGAAGGEADPPRPRDFPLGLRRAGAGAPRARGVTSSSCSTRSRAPSNRRSRWRA